MGYTPDLKRMQILVVKTPPAYVVDGFDVRGLRAGHVYDLDTRLANYLVIAGYAERVHDQLSAPSPHDADESEPSTST
jgi:hypothetical protein